MNSAKYANLPDIDTAQDIYETEDTFQARSGRSESDDEEAGGAQTRQGQNGARGKQADANGDVLDVSNLLIEEAGRKFQKAERRRDHRPRLLYSYPDSSPPSPTSPTHSRSLGTRLRALQAELDSLESELADPTNPLLQVEETGDGTQIDAGVLMRGLVDVRGRLEKVKKGKEGRGRLVGVLTDGDEGLNRESSQARAAAQTAEESSEVGPSAPAKDDDEQVVMVELDRRVGELEDLVGSSSIALDETSPLPAPLLPMLTKLNSQLALLTQPRHLDSISRRLKLLISDLDRLSSAQQTQAGAKRTQQSSSAGPSSTPSSSAALQELLLPLLARLAPHLPHLPHMLTRMRTLSSLHAAAADFQGTLGTLEEEQLRVRTRLEILGRAVEGVEKSLDDNATVVRNNVEGLEDRVDKLVKRLDALG